MYKPVTIDLAGLHHRLDNKGDHARVEVQEAKVTTIRTLGIYLTSLNGPLRTVKDG